MYSLTAAIMAPWALVSVRLALAVIPVVEDRLKVGSKPLRNNISQNMMERLQDTVTASGGGMSSTEPAPVTLWAM